MDNPCTSWLADSSWDNITELDKLPNFHGIMASFEQYPRDWNLWFTSAEPENAALPGLFGWSVHHWEVAVWVCEKGSLHLLHSLNYLVLFFLFLGDWDSNCNELQKMLIVRSLRQDRVSFCVTSFIVNNLGSRFVEPPVLDMKAVSVSSVIFLIPVASSVLSITSETLCMTQMLHTSVLCTSIWL